MYFQDKNVDVLFFLEHKDREIEITCELAKHLISKEGLKIAIASELFDLPTAAFRLRPKVVVTPSTSFAKGSAGAFFFEVFGDRIAYVNLNYEQFLGSWLGNFKSANHPISKQLQKHFVWGEHFKNYLLKAGVMKNNIIITGRPSFSVIAKNYEGKKDYYRNLLADSLHIDPLKKWIFIGLTDGLAFKHDKLVSCLIAYGGDERKIERHIQWVKKTIEALIDWIYRLDKDPELSHTAFILRPHPSVSTRDYEILISNQVGGIPKNLVISKDHNALSWMAASDKYYTNFSTLSLESYLLKIPSYILRPLEEGNDESYWWCDSLPKIQNYDQFRRSILNGDLNREQIDKLREEITYYVDVERNALVETARRISSLARQVKSYPIWEWKKYLAAISTNPKRAVGIYLRRTSAKLRINPFHVIREGIISDYFDSKEIERRIGTSSR